MTTAIFEDTMTDTLSLQDVPDLSGILDGERNDTWQNGWYNATILGERSFTDRNGNDRVFASSDSVSANGDSRNIRLQVQVKRSDGKELFVGSLINYRPDDLSEATVQQVIADRSKPEGEQDPTLTRSFLALQSLSKLQKIAGVRNFSRTSDGGLDITSLFGKSCYARLKDDDRNPQYKTIAEMREDRPKKAPVL